MHEELLFGGGGGDDFEDEDDSDGELGGFELVTEPKPGSEDGGSRSGKVE